MKVERIKVGKWTTPIFQILTADEGDPKIRKTGTRAEGKFGLKFDDEFSEKMAKPHPYVSDVIIAVADNEIQIKQLIYEISKEKKWL